MLYSSAVTTAPVPLIYVRIDPPSRLTIFPRLFALAVALGTLATLLTAAAITPDLSGVGTHRQLGLQPCAFLTQTGVPCAGCGMTTSFSWLTHGHPLLSLYTQPFGCVLAILTAAAFWGGLYVAATGRPVYLLLQRVPLRYYLCLLVGLGISAWVWKIIIHLSGHDI